MDEMYKLHAMLMAAHIPHTFMRMNAIIFGANARQICIYKDNTSLEELDDVIFHRSSKGHELGLLETYNLGECCGFETAEEVFAGWVEKFFS